jgi:hypothetical protein
LLGNKRNARKQARQAGKQIIKGAARIARVSRSDWTGPEPTWDLWVGRLSDRTLGLDEAAYSRGRAHAIEDRRDAKAS